MAHDPKLTAYIIQLKPVNSSIENTNRNLFKSKIGDTNLDESEDSYLFIEMCKIFISTIDSEEMYTDTLSKKCLTANQANIDDNNINTNIRFHSSDFIIEGIVEGGNYGKKRKKTLTSNKNIKEEVSEKDAITDDFYFLYYAPPSSKKSILLLQSYSDDSVDTVMKKFWKNFLCFPSVFNQPSIDKYIPKKIIDDFKEGATVSNFTYSTEIPGETLLSPTTFIENQNFKVTIKIEPTDKNIEMTDLENIIKPIEKTTFWTLPMNLFKKKTGTLKDKISGKTTPFQLENNFDIKPNIILSNYIVINHDDGDFDRIKEYCFKILEELKQEVFLQNAVQER